MNILFAGHEIAGQMATYARALREQDHHAEVLLHEPHPHQHDAEHVIPLSGKSPAEVALGTLQALNLVAENRYDVVHLFFFGSLMPGGWTPFIKHYLELPLLNALGCKVFMQFWGCDLRHREWGCRLSPYHFCNGCPNDCPPREEKQAVLDILSPFVAGFIASHPSHLTYGYDGFDPALILPAVDLAATPFAGCRPPVDGQPVRVLHAPTDRRIKGTPYVIQAVEQLKREGFNIDFRLVENMSHKEAMREYRESHIVIDQLRAGGGGGVLAVECLALGKIVVAPRAEGFDPPDPRWPADPDTLLDQLRRLLQQPERWPELAAQGRRFVEQRHDSRAVAKQLIALYEGAPAPAAPRLSDRMLTWYCDEALRAERDGYRSAREALQQQHDALTAEHNALVAEHQVCGTRLSERVLRTCQSVFRTVRGR